MCREREATTDEVLLLYPALFITVILADAFSLSFSLSFYARFNTFCLAAI
jgi:hypothetical protein